MGGVSTYASRERVWEKYIGGGGYIIKTRWGVSNLMCKTESKGDAGSINAIMGCGVCRFPPLFAPFRPFSPLFVHNNVTALLITEKPDSMLFRGIIYP